MVYIIHRSSFKDLLNSPPRLKHKVIVRLLYATGMRAGELVTIRQRDINLEDKTIKVFDSKKKTYFTLPLDTKTCDLLTEYMKTLPHGEWLFPSNWGPRKGEHVSVRAIQWVLKKYSPRHDNYPRMFRYFFARRWIIKKGSLTGLQSILRHKSISSTAVYIDNIRFEDESRKEYDQIMAES